jgi:hypothetical protein
VCYLADSPSCILKNLQDRYLTRSIPGVLFIGLRGSPAAIAKIPQPDIPAMQET